MGSPEAPCREGVSGREGGGVLFSLLLSLCWHRAFPPGIAPLPGKGGEVFPSTGYTAGLGAHRQPQQNSGSKQPQDRNPLPRRPTWGKGKALGQWGDGEENPREQWREGLWCGEEEEEESHARDGAGSHGSGHLVAGAVCSGLAIDVPMKGQKPWWGERRATSGSLERKGAGKEPLSLLSLLVGPRKVLGEKHPPFSVLHHWPALAERAAPGFSKGAMPALVPVERSQFSPRLALVLFQRPIFERRGHQEIVTQNSLQCDLLFCLHERDNCEKR